MIDLCLLGNSVVSPASCSQRSGSSAIKGLDQETIPKFSRLDMSDEAECGWCSSRIVASFPCPTLWDQVERRGSCIPQNDLHTSGLGLFLAATPVFHTCVFPPECLLTSLFPQIHLSWVIFICHVGTPRSNWVVSQRCRCLVEVSKPASRHFFPMPT